MQVATGVFVETTEILLAKGVPTLYDLEMWEYDESLPRSAVV